MSDLIKILIADDHPIVRQGLTALLVPRNGMTVIGEAVNGRQAVEMVRTLQPDVILMDMVMPELTGTEATSQIKQENPDARILILTSFGEDDSFLAVIKAGALGYLLKDSQPDDLFQAIRTVYAGKLIIPSELAAKLVHQQSATPEARDESITNREAEVLAGVAQGLSNQEIAEQLGVSTNTVRSHISNMLRKLELANRTQLAIYVLEREQ